MCLSTVQNRQFYPYQDTTAYKIFKTRDGKLYPLAQGQWKPYEMGKIYDCVEYHKNNTETVLCSEDEEIGYPTGFHSWEADNVAKLHLKQLKDVLWEEVVLVQVRCIDIHTIGYQALQVYGHYGKCFVSSKIQLVGIEK